MPLLTIVGEPRTRSVWVDDEFLTPERSQQLWNHSPDGFNWGYGGSGPAQLALALLLAAGVTPRTAVRLHQTFKWEHIAPLPQHQPFVLALDVRQWVRQQARHRHGRQEHR
jgi:hypothetical protein